MRNTFYGSLGGSFAGSGLFWRCLSMWALVIGPLVVALAVAATFTDWPAMTGALGRGSLEGMVAAPTDTGQVNLWLWLLGTWVAYTVILGVAVYPAYRAIVMRWWHGGLWLGGAVAASERRIRLCYSAYLRYLLYVVLFSIALAAVVGVGVALIRAGMRGQINFSSSRRLRAALLVVSVIVGYVIYLLGVSAIDQLVVKMRLWQAPVESVAISDIAALHHVQASKATSSALGEGLADALGIGAI
jgi:hypothetical protein